MSDKVWKANERKVSSFFNTTRTPLSGGNGKQTRSDSLHQTLFIECKYRVRHAVISLWRLTKELAVKEKKLPVVCLCEKGKEGFWIIVHSDDLQELCEAMNYDVRP